MTDPAPLFPLVNAPPLELDPQLRQELFTEKTIQEQQKVLQEHVFPLTSTLLVLLWAILWPLFLRRIQKQPKRPPYPSWSFLSRKAQQLAQSPEQAEQLFITLKQMSALVLNQRTEAYTQQELICLLPSSPLKNLLIKFEPLRYRQTAISQEEWNSIKKDVSYLLM